MLVIAGSVPAGLASSAAHNKYLLGYVLYGLIAFFWVILPSTLAYGFAWDVPFPTIFWTIWKLEQRLHFVALVIVAGLAVLTIHLALYPWPDIIRDLKRLHDQFNPSPHVP